MGWEGEPGGLAGLAGKVAWVGRMGDQEEVMAQAASPEAMAGMMGVVGGLGDQEAVPEDLAGQEAARETAQPQDHRSRHNLCHVGSR